MHAHARTRARTHTHTNTCPYIYNLVEISRAEAKQKSIKSMQTVTSGNNGGKETSRERRLKRSIVNRAVEVQGTKL